MRRVELLTLRPRTDIGRLAAEVFRATPPRVDGRLGWLLNQIADRANDSEGESDLLSYVLFDQAYTGQLEQLGWEDARDQEDELAAFFCGASDCGASDGGASDGGASDGGERATDGGPASGRPG